MEIADNYNPTRTVDLDVVTAMRGGLAMTVQLFDVKTASMENVLWPMCAAVSLDGPDQAATYLRLFALAASCAYAHSNVQNISYFRTPGCVHLLVRRKL